MSLDIDHVTKRFGATTALDGLTFEVGRGEVFGFLGANGAGKTTTMRICLGIIRADAGEIRWDGRPTADLPRRTWGYLPEERGLYPRMAVLDQLVYFGSLYGEPPDRARREATAWLQRFRIADAASRRAEELSKGNQQKVQFIAAVLHDPEVLLMDEPFTGLDPVNLILLREAFMELRDRGRTLDLLDPPDGGRRGAVRIGRHRRPRAAGRRRHGPRPQARERPADDPARRRRWRARRGSRRPAGVDDVRPVVEGAELELAPAGRPQRDPRARSSARGAAVTRFDVAEPSLEALFIEHVGRPSDDGTRLAADVVAPSLPAGGLA